MLKEYIREVLLLQEAKIDDVKAKYPLFASIIADNFASLKTKYIEWAAKTLNNEPMPTDFVARKIYNLLVRFDFFLDRNLVPKDERDINSFQSLEELEVSVSLLDMEEVEREKGNMAELEIKKDAETTFKDGRLKILIPKSEEASCFYGRGTRWCIAFTQAPNKWNQHVLKDGWGFVFVFDRKFGDKYAIIVDKQGKPIDVKNQLDQSVGIRYLFERYEQYIPQFRMAMERAKMVPIMAQQEQTSLDQ